MARPYIIMGPPVEDDSEVSTKPRKSLSTRRDPKHVTNLRTSYLNSSSPPQLDLIDVSKESSTVTPTTIHLPPTPPSMENQIDGDQDNDSDLTDVVRVPSITATPVNQHSPPTPENTPPRRDLRVPIRPFLAVQPSFTSTKAESFRTAKEDIYSDDESEISLPHLRGLSKVSPPSLPEMANEGTHRPTVLHRLQMPESPDTSSLVDEVLPSSATLTQPLPEVFQYLVATTPPPVQNSAEMVASDKQQLLVTPDHLSSTARSSKIGGFTSKATMSPSEEASNRKIRRDKSLRDRLEEARQINSTPSTDKFANIIGWTNDVHTDEEIAAKRWSGMSAASTIEAYVIDSPPTRKRGTLRHVGKNPSLRSASSPIPNSNRSSLQSTSDSPHRLVHKKAKLNNQIRWSDGSDFSRSFSVGSSPAVIKPDVIKVAVIPEKSSSSTSSSQRQSMTNGGTIIGKHNRTISAPTTNGVNRKRTMSEATDRSRDRKYPPQVPPQIPIRSSSRSAPTSQATSRANSITSEHFTVERKQAEKDLRLTLDRMESERRVSSASNTPPAVRSNLETPALNSFQEQKPRTKHLSITNYDNNINQLQGENRKTSVESPDWTNVRPPTMLGTPFSAPSFMTGSPEIEEATAINLFPHNNKSVQLIEPTLLSESQAVRELREQHATQLNHLPSLDVSPVRDIANDPAYSDSPLRHPRHAPQPPSSSQPPQYSILPQAHMENGHIQDLSRTNTAPVKRLVSSRTRPTIDNRTHSDSFAKSLIRNFSTRQAKNPRANQNIDSSSHPLWRPGAFWDDGNGQSPEQQYEQHGWNQERGLIVRNSLGLPQQRSVIIGPATLLRRLSNAARSYYTPSHPRNLHKQSSITSFDRLSAARNLYQSPTTNLSLQFARLKDMQTKLLRTRSKREEERREKRRDLIRKSIGPNITPKSDSRFPVSM